MLVGSQLHQFVRLYSIVLEDTVVVFVCTGYVASVPLPLGARYAAVIVHQPGRYRYPLLRPKLRQGYALQALLCSSP